MRTVRSPFRRAARRYRRALHRHRCKHARLPWRELEAEARRQGCSAADIFFDVAGRGAHALGADDTVRADGSP